MASTSSPPYTVEYIYQLEIKAMDGADIPVLDIGTAYDQERKVIHHPTFPDEVKYIWKPRRTYGTRLDDRKEDLWLFNINIWRADMEFVIGGVYFKLGDSFYADMKGKGLNLNWSNEPGDVSDRDRWVAVRTPKHPNPMVTVTGYPTASDGFCALSGIGLFVKANAAEKHEFIMLKTTNRLNPVYAEKYRKETWYNEDMGVGLVNRSISAFPKQLYGTKGVSGSLYDEFVTSEPNQDLSAKHKELADKYNVQNLKAYSWFLKYPTLIVGEFGSFNYCTGIEMKESAEDGLLRMAKIFSSVVGIAVHLATGSWAALVTDIAEIITDNVLSEEVAAKAGVKGFVSALSDAVKAAETKHADKVKAKDANVNTKGVKKLKNQSTYTTDDFGIWV